MSARRFLVSAIGLGCLLGYARMASLGFVGYLSQDAILSVDAWYGVRSVAGLCTLAVLAFAGLRRWFAVGPAALMAATAAAVAAAIVFAVDASGDLGAIVAVLGGMASAVLMYVWMLQLCCFSTRLIVEICLAGLLVAGAIVLGVPYLDEALGLVVAVFAAFVAGAVALRFDPGLSSCRPDGALDRATCARMPWLCAVMVLACGFLATIAYGIAEHLTWLYDWEPSYIAFGVGLAATVGAVGVMMARMDAWVYRVWIPPLVLLAFALAFSCIAMRGSIRIGVGLMIASVLCARFLYWMVFPALFAELKVPRAFLTAVVLFVANGSLAALAGDALGLILPHSMQNLGGMAGLMTIALAIVFAVTCIVCSRFAGRPVFWGPPSADTRAMAPTGEASVPAHEDDREDESRSADTGAPADTPASTDLGAGESEGEGAGVDAPVDAGFTAGASTPIDALRVHMEALSADHGLTPRESEVAFLTVQGFSCAYIAEKLVVSHSTVRFHQQNIYRKFDVHSRNELIEAANQGGQSADGA